MQDGRPVPEGTAPEAPPARLSAREMLVQFILLPMAVAAVCSAIFVGIRWMTAAERTASQYADDLRSPDRRVRWSAALEAARRDLRDPAVADALMEILSEKEPSGGWSPMDLLKGKGEGAVPIRGFAAQQLGRLKDPRAAGALSRILREDADGAVRLHAALALGEIGEAATGEEGTAALCEALLSDRDAGVRKAAAFSLGFQGARGREALAGGLSDADPQVRWNAALALARRGDAAAVPVVEEMLRRDSYAAVRVPSADGAERPMNDAEIQSALTGAIQAAARLPDAALDAALARLESDPSLAVRTLAKRARIERAGAKPE